MTREKTRRHKVIWKKTKKSTQEQDSQYRGPFTEIGRKYTNEQSLDTDNTAFKRRKKPRQTYKVCIKAILKGRTPRDAIDLIYDKEKWKEFIM